jgi:glycosyltransferase involved in cell wall biosynthesis
MQHSSWQTVIVVMRVGEHRALADELSALGCVVHDLNVAALMNPRAWIGTWQMIRRECPDVVQTWMHHADFIGGLAAWLAGVKNVIWGVRAGVVWRNPKDSETKTHLFHQALVWASRLLPAKIIGNSQTALKLHAQMGYPSSKFVCIPNGIDATRFCPSSEHRTEGRKSLGIPEHVPVIGFVARFHPLKELERLFQVVGQLQLEHEELRLVLCGGDASKLYPAAKAAFEAIPDPERVSFLPFRQEMEEVYPLFDMLLMCSGDAEAFPNVLLEAMACGVPVVATAGGDARLIVGDTGRVVDIGDNAALLRACEETLALTTEQRAEQTQRARTRAVMEFTLERAASRFVEVYEEVAGSR